MRTIAYTLEIGYPGCEEQGEMNIPDDFTDADIDNLIDSMAIEHANEWEGDSRLGWDCEMSQEKEEEYTEQFYEGVYGHWKEIFTED